MQKSNANNAQGIDVSHHNGSISWDQVRAAGKSFVFIKASQGISYRDPKFLTNVKEARRAGLLVGAYHFLDATSAATAKAEASNFHSAMQAAGGPAVFELPPVLDYEDNPGKLSKVQITAVAEAFLTEIERLTGRKPLLYSGNSFAGNFEAKLSKYKLWVARYSTEVPYTVPAWSAWSFWQYSSKGKVAGIQGNVDLNEYAGTVEELYAAFGVGVKAGEKDSDKQDKDSGHKTPPLWKEQGRQWLIKKLGLSEEWASEDPIDIGTLGTLLSRFHT
ncbi:hypothetical protein DCC85_14470 [Paenibacillus sp. CAA11]|uniref:glycoside hydrolase family 25 protein n=1 Tax=Paenibacillus sp. CAA11 TaxID=1532905 RepID=UPI000D3447CF|nr:glycoside hydrolase family 25 protein [Paenibacillus sp. CAA11]AWB45310.1 hypothetical protein DCC85_14470 [Paenibacillus sp. CAA11]